ncbi:Spore germination protein B1 [Paenibacillus solanacearum]|uniref:Spore germination protein B1 n=1 Tax=Paenibacillus solanacearum TaxID=2048548 RepID=A0A916K3F2_9BACL|nr:spore germination protein [Paenibacillus solanacearum]CAG7629820.1 Spore germination protein B1 [Paenibacillus solanacearum]
MGLFRRWLNRRAPFNRKVEEAKQAGDETLEVRTLTASLEANLRIVRSMLGASPDVIVRTMVHKQAADLHFALIYIDGLVDALSINQMIAEINKQAEIEGPEPCSAAGFYRLLKDHALAIGSLGEALTLNDVWNAIFNGSTVIMVDGCVTALTADTAGGDRRAVEEPSSQTVIRGPKEGFTENFRTNTAMIRRKIKSPDLRIDCKTIGTKTQTNVAVIYLHGVANDEVVNEIHKRLNSIDTDSILESGYIEEFIQDAAYTPFPTVMNTERPDAAAAGILEGQVVILVDGTPFVLIAPVTFFKFFQSSEDYYQRFDIASFLRLIRFVSFVVSMLLPSLYIAITTFHQEMLPTTLLIGLAAQREGVPFPALVEAMLMELTFEVLREAGVRMPRVIGPAISIVGALVLGQAAVQAGLVSGAMVIVVSFTAIANFVIPALNMATAARLIRFTLMILGATLGLFGIVSGLMALLIHMSGLRSFGISYLLPVAPLVPGNLKDIFVRVPWWKMNTRPRLISPNHVREGKRQKPSPPSRPQRDEKDT